MFQSLSDAFRVLDTHLEGIPFDAIEYLRNHPADPAITEKIVFALENAYDEDVYYNEDVDSHTMPTPLWYAIVAETHLSEALVEPVISLFTNEDEEEDWDFLSEQGQFLLGKLAEQFPDAVLPKVLDVIEDMAAEGTGTLAGMYLYDALYFGDWEKYGERMLRIFQMPLLDAPEIFACIFSARQVKEAIPLVRARLEKIRSPKLTDGEAERLTITSEGDLKATLEELETGVVANPETLEPFCKLRGDWRAHYEELEEQLFFDGEDEDDEEEDDFEDDYLAAPDELNDPRRHDDDYIPFEHVPDTYKRDKPKTGRNDPCPCGSGKKFKQCHLGKGAYD